MYFYAFYVFTHYSTDTDEEIAKIIELSKENGAYDAVVSTHYAQGGMVISYFSFHPAQGGMVISHFSFQPAHSFHTRFILGSRYRVWYYLLWMATLT